MSKRPPVDLAALTAGAAIPMPEAQQRTAPAEPVRLAATAPAQPPPKTENLEQLAFKVPKSFRRRFRKHAADADLKLNELLFDALAAWEKLHDRKL